MLCNWYSTRHSSSKCRNYKIILIEDKLIAMSFPHPVDDMNPKHINKIDVCFYSFSDLIFYLSKFINFRKSPNILKQIIVENTKCSICVVSSFEFFNLLIKVQIIDFLIKEERHYDEKYFNFNVERFLINDYDVPSLKKALEFVQKLSNEQLTNPSRVNVLHCMGGKGRTGTICSMFLLYSGICQNAEVCIQSKININIKLNNEFYNKDAMKFFALKRTSGNQNDHFKGVETPSQMRFVNYMDEIVNKYHKKMPKERRLHLTGIKLTFSNRKNII